MVFQSCHFNKDIFVSQAHRERSYLVPLVPLVPRLEHQLPVSVPALVQTLQLLQVDPPVQSVLQAPLRGLVLRLAPAAVPVAVAVTVAGHREAQGSFRSEEPLPVGLFVQSKITTASFASQREAD